MKDRLTEATIAMRIAKELNDGECVNLGVGIGTLVVNFVPPDREVIFHTERGAIGHGKVLTEETELMDVDLINASGQYLLSKPGMSICDIAEALDVVRTGRIDVTVLGALQVSERGDLANWTTDPQGSGGTIGGAMDMPIGARKVIVGMTHTTKQGRPKIVKKCTLPLTAPECVDLIVTDVALIEVTPQGLVLREFVPGWTLEEIQAITEPTLTVAPDLGEMELA